MARRGFESCISPVIPERHRSSCAGWGDDSDRYRADYHGQQHADAVYRWLVLAYLLAPVINRLNHRLPRRAAGLLVYAVGVGGVLLVLVVPPSVSQVIRLTSAITPPERLTRLAGKGLRWCRENVLVSLQAPVE